PPPVLSLFIIAIIALLAGATEASGQNCYKLVYPNEPFGQYSNPDSVKINTRDSAGGRYAKGWFSVSFTKCVIEPEYAPADSSVYVSWQDIDTNFYNLRNFFDSLEQQFGEFTLLKVMPQITDTSLPGSKEYHLRFDNEVHIESVELFFDGAPEIRQCAYINRATRLLSNPTFYHPKDRAFQLGIVKDGDYPEVIIPPKKLNPYTDYPDETSRKLRFGYSAALYLSHLPMAWEITRGKDNIVIDVEDNWVDTDNQNFKSLLLTALLKF
ncbi:MAG: hypothetical protein LC116_01235, partial [Bacteroidetes bacterium]|nr:hypothetical protein [Bacteroidota bacterium]